MEIINVYTYISVQNIFLKIPHVLFLLLGRVMCYRNNRDNENGIRLTAIFSIQADFQLREKKIT